MVMTNDVTLNTFGGSWDVVSFDFSADAQSDFDATHELVYEFPAEVLVDTSVFGPAWVVTTTPSGVTTARLSWPFATGYTTWLVVEGIIREAYDPLRTIDGERRFLTGPSSLQTLNDTVTVGYIPVTFSKTYTVVNNTVTDVVSVTNNNPYPLDFSLLNGVDNVFVIFPDGQYDAVSPSQLWDIVVIPAGATLTYTSDALLPGVLHNNYTDFPLSFVDTATGVVTYNGSTIEMVTDDAMVTYAIDMSVQKTVIQEAYGIGSEAVFEITVTNTGYAGMTGLVLTDIVPAGFACVSGGSVTCSGSNAIIDPLTINPNSTQTFTIRAERLSDTIVNYTNTAILRDMFGHEIDRDSLTSQTLGAAYVSVTKDTLTPSSDIHFPGDLVEFEIRLTNTWTRAATWLQIQDVFDPSTVNYVSHTFVWYTDIDGIQSSLISATNPRRLGVDVWVGQTVVLRVVGEIVSAKGDFVSVTRTNEANISDPGNHPGTVVSGDTDTSEYMITPRREVSIVKEFIGMVDEDGTFYPGQDPYGASDKARYRITVLNTGNVMATWLVVQDTSFDAGLAFSGTSRTTDFDVTSLTRSNIDVDIDDSVSWTMDLELLDDRIASCNNTAVVSGISAGEILVSSSTTTDCQRLGMARLFFTKTHNNDVTPDRGLTPHGPSLPGDQTSFTLTITNNGTLWASDIVLWDVLPVQLWFVSATPAPATSSTNAAQRQNLSIPAGWSIDVVLTTELISQTGMFVGDLLTNTGVISDPLNQLGVSIESALDDATVPVVEYMAWDIQKIADPVSVANGVLSGDPIRYTVVFRNVGNTWFFFNVADTLPTTYVNYVDAYSTVTLPAWFSAWPGGIAWLDLIEATFGTDFVPRPNTAGNYTDPVVWFHNGPSDYLPVNGFGEVTIDVVVSQDGFSTIDNTVCLQYHDEFFYADSFAQAQNICDDVTLNSRAQVIVEKRQVSPDPISWWDQVVFEIAIINTGNTAWTDEIFMVDIVPPLFTGVTATPSAGLIGVFGNTVTRNDTITIPAQDEYVITVTAELAQQWPTCGDLYRNEAFVYLWDSDTDPLLGSDTAEWYVCEPTLSFEKRRVTGNPYIPWDEVGFELVITNDGARDVDNVNLVDTFPTLLGSWTASIPRDASVSAPGTLRRPSLTIPANSGLVISLTGTVNTTVWGVSVIPNFIDEVFYNTGTITYGVTSDTVTSVATGVLLPGMGMEVSKTSLITWAQLGDPIEFVINYRNTWNVEIRFDVTDFWPQWIDFVSATMIQDGQSIAWQYNSTLINSPLSPYANNGEVQWTIPAIGQTLDPGESGEIRIIGTISAGEFACFDNTVRVQFAPANTTSPLYNDFISETASDVVCPTVGLEVEKTLVWDLPEWPGDTVLYEVEMTNIWSTDATDIWILDTMPFELLTNSDVTTYFIDAMGVRRDIAPSSIAFNQELVRSWTATVPTIPAQDSITLYIEATINDTVSVGEDFINNVCVRPTPQDVSWEVCDSSTSTVTLSDLSLMTFTKTADHTEIVSGDIVEFTLTLDVPTTVSSTYNVVFEDILPPGLVFVDSTDMTQTVVGQVYDTVAWVAPGDTVTRRFRAQVVSSTYALDPLTNTGTVILGAWASVSDDVTLDTIGDVMVTKTFLWPDVQVAGDVIEYEIVVQNVGSTLATGVVLYDIFDTTYFTASATNALTIDGSPATLVTSSYGGDLAYEIPLWDIPAWGTRTVRLRGTLSVDDVAGTDITNRAVVEASRDADPTNNEDIVVHEIVGTPDLYIRKELVPGTFVQSGDAVQFVVTYGNSGDRVASWWTLTDVLSSHLDLVGASSTYTATPPSIVFTGPALMPWDSASITVDAVLNDTYLSGTIFDNTVTIVGDWEDDLTNNTATATGVIMGIADIAVEKLITSNPVLSSWDVVTYEIIVTNNGTSSATGIRVFDLWPDALDFVWATPPVSPSSNTNYTYEWIVGGPLDPGQSTTIVVSGVLLDAYAIQGTSFTNNVMVQTTTTESDVTNNTWSATDIVWGAWDLEVIKTHNGVLRRLGDEVEFTITVTNTGVQSITGYIVTDPLPGGLAYVTWSANITPDTIDPLTWSGGVLTPWQSETYTWRARYDSLVDSDIITNTVTVSTDDRELRPQNNTDSTDVTVVPIANVFVEKALSPQTVWVLGDLVTFTLTFGNNGRAGASGVVLSDILPPQFVLDSWSSNNPIITTFAANTTNAFDLPADAWGVLTLVARLNTQPLTGGVYTNTATIATTTEEVTDIDNTSTVTWNIAASLDIDITKTALPSWTNGAAGTLQGATVDFVIDVRNAGTIPLTGVVVSDIRPNTMFLRFDGLVVWGALQPASLTNLATVDLAVWQTTSVRLRGTILDDSFVSLENIGQATVIVGGQTFVFTDPADITPPPAVCGDGFLSPSEECDRSATGAIIAHTPVYAGQVCNTSCQIETEFIVNVGQICFGMTDICIDDDVEIDIEEQEPTLTLTKTANKTTNLTQNEEVVFSVVVRNDGPGVARNVRLTDIWPDTEMDYITGSISPAVAWDITNGWVLWDMAIGEQYILTLRWRILIDNGQIINTARVVYTVNGQDRMIEDDVTLFVNTEQSACEDLEIVGSTTVTVTRSELDDGIDRRVICTAEEPETQTRYDIDCDNGQSFDERTGTCVFDDFGTYDITCRVDNGPVSNACTQTVVVKEAERLFCGDGIVWVWETCDLWDGMADGVVIGDYLDDEETLRAWAYRWSICRECSVQDMPQPACSYSDTPISLQEDEFLPFWRDVERDSSETVRSVSQCDSNDDGKVIEDSMTCSFAIYHRGAIFGTIEMPCKQDMWDDKELFDYFLDDSLALWVDQFAYQTAENAFGRYYIQMSNAFQPQTYGEYKLSLEKVSYDFCQNGRAVSGIPVARVCQSNFVVTRPYLMQEGAVSSTSNDTLDDFYNMQWDKIHTSLSLDDIDTVNESYYDGGADVARLTTDFVTKYERLAVTVPATVPGMTADSIAKVPGENIFVLTTDTDVSYQENVDLEWTVTIIVKGWDLIINGNITRNTMFIVPDGTIFFRPSDCNLRQVVNGIFLAWEPFDVLPDNADDGQLMNNRLDEDRCNNGWLTVQGVLIGDNIVDGLVNTKRSELNHWFTLEEGKSLTLDTIRDERRDEIYAWAAVLIKHNNALWASLPPWADELRQSLELYR